MECITAKNLCIEKDCSWKPLSRTKTNFNAYCKLNAPITSLFINLVLEAKNSKNIYSVWGNETVDYCLEVGTEKASLLGVLQDLLKKNVPNVLQECPIKVQNQFDKVFLYYFVNIFKGEWGFRNFLMDHSVLNGLPVWAFPSRNGRLTLRGFTKYNDYIGEINVFAEINVIGV